MARLGPEETLSELLEVAKEQLRWQQAASLSTVKDALVRSLTSTDMRKVFEACDGRRTFKEISAATGVPPATVGRWTQSWREVALVFENDDGRVQRLVSLDAVGIPLATGEVEGSRRSKRG